MSTTVLDVDSRERAPPSEQGVLDLAQYTLQQLQSDGEFVLFRGLRKGLGEAGLPSILVRAPAADPPSSACLRRMQEEYGLRSELDPGFVVPPLALVQAQRRPMLVLEDPGGLPLDLFLHDRMEITHFLRLAISVAAALGHVHSRGLIHKDVKPANILVNTTLTQAWLMGLGIASRLRRERQSSQPPEFAAGTLAYMAPEQTGRMNRSIDSRSDLYSLGVTFYQMLTGSLPFTASDPMEWVHCHIARKPIPPAERSKNVPVAVSQIVMKLLAKTAEERYQTAAGVESDLRRCLVEWECQGRIDLFALGERDAPDRLLIPEKLYGRASEVDALIECFDRVVTSGQPELVLVRGYSGVGKSSVVNELHRALVASRGLFASGKFDQYKRDIPYSTLVQALRSLVRPLLGKSDAELSSWRDDFVKALDPNGRLMVDLVPELKLIIGGQAPLPDLPPQQAQARFQLVFRRFISVFARPEHPLALFLDDLHWLDSATLDLLEDLLTRSEAAPSDLQHLILIGAYRDNEVDAAHPLTQKLQAIRNAGAKIEEITLVPLGREHLKQLIADALRCEPPRAAPLAQLVHEKTGGNPFFAVQFISSLAEEGLLRFEPDAAGWSWDLERIRAKGYTDNVVDLMVGKLTRLRPETQKAMQQLACIGNTAAITTLSIALGTSEEQVHADLSEAVRLELVERLKGSYRFVHDRVQEAAYSLIPKGARAPVHLHIGRLLATQTPPEEREETIFEIVSHLNRGADLITEQEERERVAELNLIAGKRAKASTAYVSACAYLGTGMTLLGSEGWTSRYELALDLWLERAECEYLSGNFDAAEPLISELLARAASKIDKAAAYRLEIDLRVMKSESPKAVESALECLRLFGIEMSTHPAREQVEVEYEKVWSSLGRRSIESLIDLPLMTDPEMKAAMQVLSVLFAPALTTDINLAYLHVCHMVNVTLKYGTTGASTPAYAFFGIILRTGFNRYADSYRFGRLACDLVEKHNLLAYKAKTYISMEMIALWTQPLQAAIDYNETAFRAAVETGDLHVAGYSRSHTVTDLLLRGDHLDDVWQESERGLDFARRAKFHDVVDAIVSQQRFIENMRGRTAHFSTFSGATFDEDRFEAQLTEDRTATTVSRYWMYWIIKIQARFLSGDYATALVAARKAKALIWVAYSHIRLFDYYYYTALAITAAYKTLPPDEQAEWREILTEHLNQLREWAESCPATFRDKHALVAAETARLDGRELDAERLYEEAVRSARTNGFVQNEALAYELTARFYATRDFDEFARLYLRHARDQYLRWGALGKVRQLEELHPHLGEHAPAPGPTSTIGAPVEHLDLATVIKVSQAVSGEMVLEKLIDTLMRTAIEQAGAERGLLILAVGDEQRIAAEATTSGETVIVHVLDDRVSPVALPESVLQCVVRTQESVILDDASAQNLFSADPYFHGHRARSVHCLPLSNRGKLIGVLYLENNLAPRVFAPARIQVLKVLASQAAMSLENTRLYRDLAKREAKIRRLVDANIVGIEIWDLDGTLLEANDAFLRMLGYDREDLVSGLRWTDLSAARWRDRDREDVLAELQRTGRVQPLEWECIRKDGSTVPVLVGLAMFEGENQGVGFVLDLTERKRVEEALRQSEAYLAEAQRLAHTGSWAYDHVLRKVKHYSDEAFRLFGLDPRRPSGPPQIEETRQLMHPEDRERVFEQLAKIFRDKAEYEQQYRIVLPDGTVRHLHSIGHPVLNQAGELVEYFGTVMDVTERRCAEQRLLAQHRVTRILAEAATLDEATPKILQAMCECLGWDLGSLWRIDREAGVLRHAELWHAPSVVAPQFEAVTRMSTFRPGSGIPGRVWASRVPMYIPDIAQDPEIRHRDAATREGLHSAFAFPILLGSEVLGVMGFLSRDVWRPDQNLLDMMATLGSQIGQFTKRAAAVDELQLRVSMLQHIPVAAWSVMPDGTPDIVNQLWYEYTGQTPEYVNSHPEAWMATLHPEDREGASRSYWDGIRSGRGFTMEARFLRARDGTYRWHLNRAVPVRDQEGNIVRFVGTSTDVHDWRQAQEALRNTQTEFAHMTRVMTMGELTASIAHEVNQPLGAIVTSAAAGARWLATKPPHMDKARRALERIAIDGKRAGEVIRRIRALMKRQAPRKEWLDINETILEVIALAQYQLRRSEVLVETRLGHDLPLVRCDRVQLQQVLLNLIINAIEAMSVIKERPRELTIVSASDGPDAVSVEVRDSGTGLDPEDATRLFEPFFTTKEEGLGIGLSISRSIVEAHGGRLSAAANAPHGTVFRFSLPVNEPAP
jgi:PAS domain S-box-containing protein